MIAIIKCCLCGKETKVNVQIGHTLRLPVYWSITSTKIALDEVVETVICGDHTISYDREKAVQ